MYTHTANGVSTAMLLEIRWRPEHATCTCIHAPVRYNINKYSRARSVLSIFRRVRRYTRKTIRGRFGERFSDGGALCVSQRAPFLSHTRGR